MYDKFCIIDVVSKSADRGLHVSTRRLLHSYSMSSLHSKVELQELSSVADVPRGWR